MVYTQNYGCLSDLSAAENLHHPAPWTSITSTERMSHFNPRDDMYTPSDWSANDDLMRRHANRQDCDLRIYDCDRQPSWTPPETLEIDQQPVMRLAVRDQSGRLLGHLFISETGVKTIPFQSWNDRRDQFLRSVP